MEHAAWHDDAIVAVGRHRKDPSEEDVYNFGPEVRNESPEDKGNAAFEAGQYEDASNAYTLALAFDFTFAPRILSNRAEAHLALGNFKYAYIDANEALKLHANIPSEMTKLEPAELGQAFRRRAIALAATGHADRAVLDLQVANRAGTLSEKAYGDAMDAVRRSVSNKDRHALPEIATIDGYDPLESDSKDFGRTLLLADINRLILNGWKSRGVPGPKFDFRRWLSIQGILKYCYECMMSIRDEEDGRPESLFKNRAMTLHINTIRLCFANDAWIGRALPAMIPEPLFAYANMKEHFKLLLTKGFETVHDRTPFVMARSLERLGLYQDAKKAIEFALRTMDLEMDADADVREVYKRLLKHAADKPVVDFSVVESTDPICLSRNDTCSQILKKRVYGPTDNAPKPFVDVTEASPREEIAEVAKAAEEAYKRNDLTEARRLYTIAISATQRRNTYFLIRRAQIAMLEKRCESAYADASEVIKLNPNLPTAHQLKAKALLGLGFVTKATAVVEHLKGLDSTYVLDSCLTRCLVLRKDAPVCDGSCFDSYDPEWADEYADGMRFTAAQRKVHREALSVERARSMIGQGLYQDAIKLLDAPISSKSLPGALSLRAESYLKIGEPRKALKDAEEAIKLDKYFHDALVIRARSFAEIHLYSKARNATHEYLKLAPNDVAMKDFYTSLKDKADRPVLSPAELDEIERRAYYETPESAAKDALEYMQHFVRLSLTARTCSDDEDTCIDDWPSVEDSDDSMFPIFRAVASGLLKEFDSTRLERKELAVELREEKDRLTEKTREADTLKTELKGADAAKKSALVEVERFKKQLRESISTSEANKKLEKLEKSLHEKETGAGACCAIRVEVTEENKALKEELGKLRAEKASVDKELAETKAKEHRLQLEFATMQAANNELTEKLRQMNSKVNAASQATKDRELRLVAEQQKVENLTERIHELLDASGDTASAVPPPKVTTEPEELVTAVCTSLVSKVDGFKIEELLRDFKEGIYEMDGDEEARKHGYGSLKDVLHSAGTRDKLDFVYLGKPTAEVRHLVEEQQHGLQAQMEKWRKKFDWEKKRVDRLDAALKRKEDEVTRKDARIQQLANHPSCPICMDVQSDTTFIVREEDGSHTVCGHLLCSGCSPGLRVCHFCRKPVVNRVTIYTAQNAL